MIIWANGHFMVQRWSGVEIRQLRIAQRMSIREFGEYLGVSSRIVSKWEAGAEGIFPRGVNQLALDTALARCTRHEVTRFALAFKAMEIPPFVSMPRNGKIPEGEKPPVQLWESEAMQAALRQRDIAFIFKTLQLLRISQRRISLLTGQSQSEISEILAGRRVTSYDVLERIADGLGIPRGLMGLAYSAESTRREPPCEAGPRSGAPSTSWVRRRGRQQPVTTPPLLDVAWRTSSRSGTNGACVEARLAGDTVQVRDSKDLKDGHVLAFTRKAPDPHEWRPRPTGPEIEVGNSELAVAVRADLMDLGIDPDTIDAVIFMPDVIILPPSTPDAAPRAPGQ